MESILLTWDLFIIVFFLIIVAYSVMIGKEQTVKVILSSYIALLTSDAIGGWLAKMLAAENTEVIQIANENKAVVLTKIGVFVFLTVLLTVRGAFDIVVADEKSPFMRLMMTFSFGVLSAGLIISTILIFVSGASFLTGMTAGINPIESIVGDSKFVALMVENYAIWFSLPALAFMFSSLFSTDS